MPTSHSLLRYPGGKTALGPMLARMAVDNGLTEHTYYEPFAGSAGAALHMLFSGHASRLILSDKDENVAAFWSLVLTSPKTVRQFILDVDLTIAEWRRQRSIFLDLSSSPDLRGLAFFYLNRTNRSGLILSGPIGGKEQNGPYKLGARFNRDTLASRLDQISLFSDQIDFFQADVFESIRRVKRRNCSKLGKIWMYLDPPYHGWGDDLYLCKFSSDEHKRLAAKLTKETRLPWVLSYDDTSDVRESYVMLQPHVIGVSYFIHSARKAKELLLTNNLTVPIECREKALGA